jgi:hypothetical protein
MGGFFWEGRWLCELFDTSYSWFFGVGAVDGDEGVWGVLANGIFFFLSGDTCLAYLPTCTRNQVHGSVQIGRYRVSRSQVGLGWMHDDKTIFS